MLVSKGALTLSLVETADSAVWQGWLKNDLVAQFEPSEWENPDVDFYSREAGQMLADTLSDAFAIVAEIDGEADMIKHPDGKTTDVPKDEEKNVDDVKLKEEDEATPPPVHEDEHMDSKELPEDGEDAKVIIIHLNNLMDKADKAMAVGRKTMASVILAEVDEYMLNLKALRRVAWEKRAKEIMVVASQKLEQGLDCSAELDKVDFCMSIVASELMPMMKRAKADTFLQKLSKIFK